MRRTVPIVVLALVAAALPAPVSASHTPDPSSVTVAGSLQSELGCPGDWQPDCAATHLTYDATDNVWQGTFAVPAGNWEYKAPLNDSWDENYGLNGAPGGANIPLNLAAPTSVRFYYSHLTHWITDNQGWRIVTAPGSFQSELGCPGDWQPDCLRSWLQDVDGDGTYTFATTAIPAGSYEAKAAINESWDENYGEGGVPNGPNIAFTVPADGSTVGFGFASSTNVLTITVTPPAGHGHDNNVEYFGLGHNSHSDLYRVPFGAVTPGTEFILRFRTYHNDVTGVRVRLWDGATATQSFLDMTIAASDVSCYDPAQPEETCDFWQATYASDHPTTLFYRFIVTDGTAVAYYDDDSFFDGGWGEATPALEDESYVVTVYHPDFQPVEWLQDAVVYQIFPDRFRNGRASNDPSPTEPRYGYPPEPLDQIINMTWGELPEGFCRHYVDPADPCNEGPRGRDYFGGDLRGVQQRLNYLESLGVTAIYFNPIFEAGSNHAYDTQDYYAIDHFFGTTSDFAQLIKEADKRGIRIILDGVFNHVSSDSVYFDRYHHYSTVGACESITSPYRDWFIFRPLAGGPCAGPEGSNTMTYDAWFGFDSLPVLDKNKPEVQALIYGDDDAVARYWLEQGASGWRLDVMGDPSFPSGFWSEFRDAVKATDPEAVIIGELWKKHEVLADAVHGHEADTTMNYRFRNAILGFFGEVDFKGFPDDGATNQPPSRFALKITSIREDYPDATWFNLLNLLDSHDTERILWSLTPGGENREDREFNATNLEEGKRRLRLATVVQMTMPGAPMIYYGDEVGVTGADDPDDRRTFPWDDGPFGIGGDVSLYDHYRLLTDLRHDHAVFRDGALTFLLADDNERTLAYLMRTANAAGLVVLNRSDQSQTLEVPLGGLLPDPVVMTDVYGGLGDVTASGRMLSLTLPALSAAILLPAAGQDLVAPAAPTGLMVVEEGDEQVSLAWNAVPGASSYNIYRSPVTGGGYELVGDAAGTGFTDTGLRNGLTYYYVVRAVDAAGNLGPASNEVSALPHLVIGWANTQWPPTMTHTISVIDRTDDVYGQVWIDGETNQPGPTPGLAAQLGFGPEGSDPQGADWMWVDAVFNVDAGNNDEFKASLLPEEVGSFDYLYRYSTTGGRDWLYADLNGPVPEGALPSNPGGLTVISSGDTTAPATPLNLVVVSGSPAGIELAWDAVTGDASLYGYEVRRSDASGGPYVTLALLTATTYTDTDVDEGATYYYVVRAVDMSFNRSGHSNEVAGTASLRTVTITFRVTEASTTPAGSTVYITGTLSRLDGGYPDWNPGSNPMTPVGSGVWEITFTGVEGTQLEYKYTLGTFDMVEKGATCEEIANRTVTLSYGSDGTQLVTDTVLNWRNISPCGN